MVTLQQLKYFQELAKTCHMTRTAERLHITQTTLSNTIKNLENQLGLPLFDRVGRTLRLNETGELYLRYVTEALMALENAQTVIDDRRENNQSVSIATSSSNLWATLIHGFCSRYPSYNIRQTEGDTIQFREMLLNQKIDFVITGVNDFSLSGLEHRVFREEQLYLSVTGHHPLAGRPGIFLAEAKEESFINLPEKAPFRSFCDSLFQKAGFPCRATLECEYTLRGKLVTAGFGVAITTHTARMQNILGDNLAYIPILDDFARRPVAIIWNPKHYLSRAALDFRDYLVTHGESDALIAQELGYIRPL